MKILLYAGGRTGSHSLSNYMCDELNYIFIHEETTDFDYKTSENFVYKRNLHDKEFNLESEKEFFDKIIILYRKDTLEQAVSGIYANLKHQWHHTKGTLDNFYEIDNKFYEENYSMVIQWKNDFDKMLEKILSYDNFFKISYEELFVEKTGKSRIDDYIGINGLESKFYNVNNKLRIKNNDADIIFLKKYILELENQVIKCKKKRLI